MCTLKSVCSLGHCLKSVKGMISSTASPSDMWILDFEDMTIYKNNLIRKAILKVSLVMKNTENLTYEANVYKMTKKFIHYRICPNFLTYFMSGECTIKQTASMLQKVGIPKKNLIRSLTDIIIKQNNNINIQHVIDALSPSIINKSVPKKYIDMKAPIVTMTMTEFIPHSRSLYDVVLSATFRNRNDSEKIIWSLILQVMIALYTLSLSKTTHNDIHIGNILIKASSSSKVSYNIDNTYYSLNNFKYNALIFDYDRSYSETLGNNTFIIQHPYMCSEYNQCNKVFPERDIIHFFSSLYINSSTPTLNPIIDQSIISNILGRTVQAKKSIINLLKKSKSVMMQGVRMKRLATTMYKPLEIIRNIAMHISTSYPDAITISTVQPNILKYDLWTIKPQYFNSNGSINKSVVDSENRTLYYQKILQYCNTIQPSKTSSLIIASSIPSSYIQYLIASKKLSIHGNAILEALRTLNASNIV
jgi:hypothetical protein